MYICTCRLHCLRSVIAWKARGSPWRSPVACACVCMWESERERDSKQAIECAWWLCVHERELQHRGVRQREAERMRRIWIPCHGFRQMVGCSPPTSLHPHPHQNQHTTIKFYHLVIHWHCNEPDHHLDASQRCELLCVRVRVRVRVHVRVCVYVCWRAGVCWCVWMYHVFMFVCMYVCLYACLYACIYVCMYACMYV